VYITPEQMKFKFNMHKGVQDMMMYGCI
jgi:hypothetical protein